jgi:FkbM family methyltransferase
LRSCPSTGPTKIEGEDAKYFRVYFGLRKFPGGGGRRELYAISEPVDLLEGSSIRNPLQQLRERFHPLFYARKSPVGRFVIRMVDLPVWLSIPHVSFKVRGRLVTHGLAFAAIGSQEPGSEALALVCIDRLKLESFWDVGANIGYYTWLLKSASLGLRAVMFEAAPANAQLICRTLKRNQLPGVELIAAGASDRQGEGYLRVDSLAGATSTLDNSAEQTFEEQHWGIPSEKAAISLVTIDDERSHRLRVDFLKIDVEGHEAAVLRGAQHTISSDQPIVFIECFHPDHACLADLEREGYRFVDSDRLKAQVDSETTNYFGFPPKFHSSIDLLLKQARERLDA